MNQQLYRYLLEKLEGSDDSCLESNLASSCGKRGIRGLLLPRLEVARPPLLMSLVFVSHTCGPLFCARMTGLVFASFARFEFAIFSSGSGIAPYYYAHSLL